MTRSVVLENSRLRASILPESGGRVWELWDLERNRQWVWQRPGGSPARPEPTSVYDEVWAGGWEELFPNDAPGPFEGRELLDHGDLWRLAWTVEEFTEKPNASLRLAARTPSHRTACIKECR